MITISSGYWTGWKPLQTGLNAGLKYFQEFY